MSMLSFFCTYSNMKLQAFFVRDYIDMKNSLYTGLCISKGYTTPIYFL